MMGRIDRKRMKVIGVLALLLPAGAVEGLSVEVDGGQVVVAGATPEGRVGVLGAGRELNGHVTLVRAAGDVVEADGTGQARYTIPWDRATQASWIVADRATGAMATVSVSNDGAAVEREQPVAEEGALGWP